MDCLRERLRGLLRQVVADTAGYGPVRVFPGEFASVRGRLEMWRAVGVALHRDSGNGYRRALGKACFERVVFRLSLREPKAPTVIVDHDIDTIGIVESGSAARECCVVEIPFRRSELPDELRKFAPIFCVTDTTAIGRKVERVGSKEIASYH